MDIGLGGVIYIWASMLFYTFWPVMLVSIFLYIKRSKINRKWKFALISIAVCYGISFIIAIATEPMLIGSVKTVTGGGSPRRLLLTMNLIKIVQIGISIFVVNLLSKKFSKE